ncbi:hypothetical protein N24_0218 [Corynebacterium suranareeae]|uniref:Uncharacterized protein n=1 Tax=Corynebacterium suranareeae TaxID=2506452 RepID=A0A160PQG9_9CORY|nr:hypothetical protein N24_0218 [Corynebacterium suranareeae]
MSAYVQSNNLGCVPSRSLVTMSGYLADAGFTSLLAAKRPPQATLVLRAYSISTDIVLIHSELLIYTRTKT